jgi:hypothetical protein
LKNRVFPSSPVNPVSLFPQFPVPLSPLLDRTDFAGQDRGMLSVVSGAPNRPIISPNSLMAALLLLVSAACSVQGQSYQRELDTPEKVSISVKKPNRARQRCLFGRATEESDNRRQFSWRCGGCNRCSNRS